MGMEVLAALKPWAAEVVSRWKSVRGVGGRLFGGEDGVVRNRADCGGDIVNCQEPVITGSKRGWRICGSDDR